jgi:hypothetical protein
MIITSIFTLFKLDSLTGLLEGRFKIYKSKAEHLNWFRQHLLSCSIFLCWPKALFQLITRIPWYTIQCFIYTWTCVQEQEKTLFHTTWDLAHSQTQGPTRSGIQVSTLSQLNNLPALWTDITAKQTRRKFVQFLLIQTRIGTADLKDNKTACYQLCHSE